jgi:ketosteroid isomerase-like protein
MTRHIAPFCAACLLLVTLTSCTVWSDKPVKAWTSATGGEHLERLFWDTVKARDWNELDKHLAPTFVYVGPNGIRERADAMKWFQGLQLSDVTLGEITVHPSGGDVVVVTCVAHLMGTRDGKPLTSNEFRMTSTWQRIDKNWMLISRAHTPPGK